MKKNQDWKRIENLISEIIDMQQKKLLACGRRIVPNLTVDDTLQPNDYIELENHPVFRYEEGVLIGMKTIQTALLALSKEQELKEL